jgi:hypothetical protein
MALMGPDGETHSHLRPGETGEALARAAQDYPHGARPGAELPDRGRWVGPRAGHHDGVELAPGKVNYADDIVADVDRGLLLDPPQSLTPRPSYDPARLFTIAMDRGLLLDPPQSLTPRPSYDPARLFTIAMLEMEKAARGTLKAAEGGDLWTALSQLELAVKKLDAARRAAKRK